MTTPRATVKAWRWDFLSPDGWFPWTAATADRDPQPRGWFVKARASCLRSNDPFSTFTTMLGLRDPEPPHYAPDPDCGCGWHAVEHLTEETASIIDELAAHRELIAEQGQPEVRDGLVVCLSRVTLTGVIPGREAAKVPHPDAVADPLSTIRGHRMRYDSITVDREWPTQLDHSRFPSPDWWPPTTYEPDLGAWVREQCAADLEAFLDEVLP